MSKQNIYDNEEFFSSYSKLRNKNNANELIEIPALLEMVPSIKDKKVLDLGCGFGEHCVLYKNKGAKSVLGIDISSKMLDIARQNNNLLGIEYKLLAIENINKIDEKFDIIISSLAFHYIEDFQSVADEAYRILNNGGYLIFSQEHPLNTCFEYGERWTKDENGKKIYANISNYSIDGKRESKWFVDGVVKYHRTFSSIINSLIKAGFVIDLVNEPIPTEDIIKEYPAYNDNIHKPDFLIIRAKKI